MSNQRNPWLQLLRPPNLFTVPGDPIAGYLLALAYTGRVAEAPFLPAAMAALASVLIYAGGLLQNDYYDRDEDRLQRPHRPIPSGRVSAGAVMTAALLLMAAGVAAAWFASPISGVVAAATLGIVTAYNAGGKRFPVVGPVLMGACRGLSLLIGAAATATSLFILDWGGAFAPPVLLSAAGLTVLVAAVTRIASRETQPGSVGPWRRVPAVIVAVWLGAMLVLWPIGGPGFWAPAGMSAIALAWFVYCGKMLRGEVAPQVVQRTVGMFIGGLMFVQAALAMNVPPVGAYVAAALLLGWLVSRKVGKRFYAS